MEIGNRVKTNIQNPEIFAGKSAEHLTNQAGTIIKYKPDYGFSDPRPAYLVEFDNPIKPWHTHQLPIKAFWFSPDNLTPN